MNTRLQALYEMTRLPFWRLLIICAAQQRCLGVGTSWFPQVGSQCDQSVSRGAMHHFWDKALKLD